MIINPGQIRGTNYIPNTTNAIDLARIFLHSNYGGFFDHEVIEKELKEIKNTGFNNVRVLGSFNGYCCFPSDYVYNLSQFFTKCRDLGLTVTYQLFNTTSVCTNSNLSVLHGYLASGISYNKAFEDIIGQIARIESEIVRVDSVPEDEPGWFSLFEEPGNSLVSIRINSWPAISKMYLDMYLDDIGSIASNFSSNLFIDLFNEPEVHTGGDLNRVADFIAYSYQRIERRVPDLVTTIGFGSPDASSSVLERLRTTHNIRISYLSYHIYPNMDSQFGESILAAAQITIDNNIEYIVVSEFEGLLYNPGKLGLYLQSLTAAGSTGKVGWQMWGFLQSNNWIIKNGVLVPIDGILKPEYIDKKLVFTNLYPEDYAAIQSAVKQNMGTT